MHRVVSVQPLSDYCLQLEFENRTKKVVDIKPFIGKGISQALLDEEYFEQVVIERGGGIAWPNGYDFCPNYLYNEVPAVNSAGVSFC